MWQLLSRLFQITRIRSLHHIRGTFISYLWSKILISIWNFEEKCYLKKRRNASSYIKIIFAEFKRGQCRVCAEYVFTHVWAWDYDVASINCVFFIWKHIFHLQLLQLSLFTFWVKQVNWHHFMVFSQNLLTKLWNCFKICVFSVFSVLRNCWELVKSENYELRSISGRLIL